MKITPTEKIFVVDTLKTILEGKSRIGKKHYRVTLYHKDLKDLINKIEEG